MAGDLKAGEGFLRELVPFVYRKYLDYAAIADIHSIKRQIHVHKGHGEIAVKGHNIKLGGRGIHGEDAATGDHRLRHDLLFIVGGFTEVGGPGGAQRLAKFEMLHGMAGIAAALRPVGIAPGLGQRDRRFGQLRIGIKLAVESDHRDALAGRDRLGLFLEYR